jgi:hypothetical protein
MQVFIALMMAVTSVSCFAVSIVFGVAATFVLTLVLAVATPATIPVILIGTFLYQNTVVAWFTPYIPDNNVFDALRGANFVVLMTAYGAFFLASFQARVRAVPHLLPWLRWSLAVAAVVTFYLLLGAARGHAKDAVLYFRNTITPVACFHIAVVAASLYRIDLRRSLLWLGAGAIVYGYCELFFAFDFLNLFNGDLYVERSIRRQIEAGVWEQVLRETGFVLRSLDDIMTTSFFNTGLFDGIVPRVFRITGPNFHSISYAYALGIMAVWLLFKGRWLLPLAALPLLLVIGSKGAAFMVVLALFARIAQRPLGAGLTMTVVLAVCMTWVAATITFGASYGDYHVLGFFAGVRDFLHNPLGQGLGFGGNLSSTTEHLDWQRAQATGAAAVPIESAVGVMLYQMGIGSVVFFGFLAAIAVKARQLLLRTGSLDFWFAFVSVVAVSANAVLQEEAYYSPLALGFCLLLAGVSLGTHLRETAARTGAGKGPPRAIMPVAAGSSRQTTVRRRFPVPGAGD